MPIEERCWIQRLHPGLFGDSDRARDDLWSRGVQRRCYQWISRHGVGNHIRLML